MSTKTVTAPAVDQKRLVRRVTAVGKNWAVVVPFESCGEKMWTVLDVYTGAAAEAEARGHALRCAALEDDVLRMAVPVKIKVNFLPPAPNDKLTHEAGDQKL